MASALGDFAKGFSSTVMPAFTAAQKGRQRALEIDKLEEEEEYRTKRGEIAPVRTITTADGSTIMDPVDQKRWNSEQLGLIGQYRGADAYADAQTKMLANSQKVFSDAARSALIAQQMGDRQAYEDNLNRVYGYISSTPGRVTVDDEMGASITTYDNDGNAISSRPILPAEFQATAMLASSPELFVKHVRSEQDVADRRQGMQFDQEMAMRRFNENVRQFGMTHALRVANHDLDVTEFNNDRNLNWARHHNDTRKIKLAEQTQRELMSHRDRLFEQGEDQFTAKMDQAADRLALDRDVLSERQRRNDMWNDNNRDVLAARQNELEQTLSRRDEEIEIKRQDALGRVAAAKGVARKAFNDAAERTDTVLNAEFDKYTDPVETRLRLEQLPPEQRREEEATAQVMGSLKNRNLIRQIAGGFLAENYDSGVTPEEAAQYAIQLVMGDPVEAAQSPSSAGGYDWVMRGNQNQPIFVPYAAHSILDRVEQERRDRAATRSVQKWQRGVQAQGEGFDRAIEATPPTPTERPATPTTRGSTVSPAPRRAYPETQSPAGAGRGIPAGRQTAIPQQ